MTQAVTLASIANSGYARNRIINGNMLIDQRNVGGAVTPTTDAYILDRWLMRQPSGIFSVQQQTAVIPNNYSASAKLTVASVQGSILATTVNNLTQYVESINISDFGWGTSSALPVTLSFWVRSSVAGTYSTALYNTNFTRAYISTYTINSANTWEYKTITVPGDTGGTWTLASNVMGVAVTFDLGSGSNYNGTAGAWGSGALRTSGSVSLSTNAAATFYITGVQLELGTQATPYEWQGYQQQLAACQRYFEKSYSTGTVPGTAGATDGQQSIYISGASSFFNGGGSSINFAVEKRTPPTMTTYSGVTGASGKMRDYMNNTDVNSSIGYVSTRGCFGYASVTQNVAINTYWQWTASAEL